MASSHLTLQARKEVGISVTIFDLQNGNKLYTLVFVYAITITITSTIIVWYGKLEIYSISVCYPVFVHKYK